MGHMHRGPGKSVALFSVYTADLLLVDILVDSDCHVDGAGPQTKGPKLFQSGSLVLHLEGLLDLRLIEPEFDALSHALPLIWLRLVSPEL